MVEALVSVAVTYANLDWGWLVRQPKLDDFQNRLGFLVTLARQPLRGVHGGLDPQKADRREGRNSTLGVL